MGLFRCGSGLLRSMYHGSSGGSAWWAVGYGLWVLDLGWSFLSLIAVCSDGFDGFVPMRVWFAPISESWVKWWIGMVGRGLWFMGFGFGLIFPLSDCHLLRWVRWVYSDVGVVCSDRCMAIVPIGVVCVWLSVCGRCWSICVVDGLVVCVYVCGFVDGLCLCVCVGGDGFG